MHSREAAANAATCPASKSFCCQMDGYKFPQLVSRHLHASWCGAALVQVPSRVAVAVGGTAAARCGARVQQPCSMAVAAETIAGRRCTVGCVSIRPLA